MQESSPSIWGFQRPTKPFWWEQIKEHVRKKIDERRSNCGNAIEKSIMSK